MAAQTQEELNNLVDQIIIDNTTNQVTPAKVRSVLKAIISSISTADAASVTAERPIIYDNFSNTFSITQASATNDGYVVSSDWQKWSYPLPFGTKEVIAKGANLDLEANTGNPNFEPFDICRGWFIDGESLYWADSAQYNGGPLDLMSSYTMLIYSQLR